MFSRMLQLHFTVELQKCSVDYDTSHDFISSGVEDDSISPGRGEVDFISSGGGEDEFISSGGRRE